ncbi:MAG: hydantoinase B/oxoprolinase family protein [Candidatus Bathyarchaeota archaeon]|nr:hydantoinase B/oxoprolinase family protein [Candidatus Bathyarchaeota archaeon]
MSVDPITVEVIKGALIYTTEEMGIVLRNSAYSPNIKERMDFSCTIFDAKRRLAAQAEHIPVHLGSMQLAVQKGLERFKGKLENGDMILFNDPYISGTHLPDITLICPIFYEGETIAYSTNKAHHSDVGGKAPGSMAGDATEIYQEGIIIPPVKFIKKNVIHKEIASIVLSNIRTPEISLGDLRAQMAANLLGKRRILELIERYGTETLQKAIEKIMDYSEKRIQNEINRMPKGVFSAEDYLENTGTSNKKVKIKATITVKTDQLLIDYTGTDKQVDGPINAVLGVTLSGVYYVLRCLTDPSIPMNDGCYRPVKVHVPEGTVMNPTPPRPVAGGNVETSQRNVDVLLKAYAQILPEKVCAACQGTMNNVAVGGINQENGKPWTFYETIAGGFGGRKGIDGVDAVHSHMTNTMNTPIEAIETTYPIRFIKYELRKDSGGPGKYRGGVGLERSWMLLAPSATLSVLAERTKIPPWGLFGGKHGNRGEHYIIRPNKKQIKLRSKCTIKIEKDDVFLVRTPGGGGYGKPLERYPELVLQDVLDELVSLETAEKEYGAIIDSTTMEIDWKSTKQYRHKQKKLDT